MSKSVSWFSIASGDCNDHDTPEMSRSEKRFHLRVLSCSSIDKRGLIHSRRDCEYITGTMHPNTTVLHATTYPIDEHFTGACSYLIFHALKLQLPILSPKKVKAETPRSPISRVIIEEQPQAIAAQSRHCKGVVQYKCWDW